MWNHLHVQAFPHELLRVETLVTANGDSPIARDLLQHQQRSIPLGRARCLPGQSIYDQSACIRRN